ncbi:MAG: translocation/assembly module TamB domain-containing protein [Bacteroidales bacterium]|nr:translocation/assembly module TamB domain-containing protein [Bacteroidales bacterium]
MSKKSLIWKIPCIVVGVILGIVLLLLIAVTVILVTPGARTAVLHKCVQIANERTDFDVDLGRLYLSPFHHSPMILYRAYKGTEDLPLHVEVDSLFIGHRGQDTLLYVHGLRLQGCMKKPGDGVSSNDFLARNIVVDQLLLDEATVHSDTLIAAVGIDAIVGHLNVKSPELNIAKGKYPLHGLRLADAYVGIELRDTETEDEDTTSTPMAFDIPDGELRNVRFVLNPMGLDIRAGSLSTNVLADVGGNLYDARRLNIGNASLTLESLHLPFDTIHGDARVDLNTNLITSNRLYARSDEFGAKADLKSTMLNLETMRVDLAGNADYRGSKANLKGFYDIDDEMYDMLVNVEQVNASPFLDESHHVELAGEIHAQGKGIDPKSPAMKCKVAMNLTNCIYDNINASGLILDAELANKTVVGNLHLPVSMTDNDLRLKAESEHQFWASNFLTPEKMSVDYHTQMKNVVAHVSGEDYNLDYLNLDFTTDTATSLYLVTQGLTVDAQSPMHALRLVDDVQPVLGVVTDTTFVKSIVSLQDLTMLDTLKRVLPDLQAEIQLKQGSPIQGIIEGLGLDINDVTMVLKSDSLRSDLALDASVPYIDYAADSTGFHLPASTAAVRIGMTEGKTTISLTANALLTDGVMDVEGLCTDARLNLNLERNGRELRGTGHLALDSLIYDNMDLGNRTADIWITPSEQFDNAIRADLRLDDIPLELVNNILDMEDIDLDGIVKVKASADGLPAQLDLSAEVRPLDVFAYYKPYDVGFNLGDTPIVMEHNNVKLNDVRIYSIDGSYLALNGGMDLNTMHLDVNLAADSFSPAKLDQGGPFPVYGELATDIRGRVTGPLDSIRADVDVTILPITDLTYPIDEKNLAQFKPYGTVNAQYNTADGDLNLGGTIHVDEGLVRYSPKLYPMIPFHVDSGSHVTLNGPIGQTILNLSASQQVKADVQSAGEETRRVTFNTGVRVKGILDSIGLSTIGFFLEAPDDETISHELASMDEDTRDGIAAVLLATGMYMGESNVAAQKDGYALSSIINSRINAAMANSKLGNIVDVDISSGQTTHAAGKTNDMNIAISKSLFNDKLRITVGSTISDNPEVNKANGLLSHISAEYKLTKSGNVFLRAFSQRDYENILEGELYKSGIGVGATKQWKHKSYMRSLGDSITRTYNFLADADITYRSNNSLGPNLTLAHSIKNLFGRGETFTVKGYGAYYWALRNRQPGDPKTSDTYKFGIDAALIFPYLHWAGNNNPDGDTRYRLGYKYENIAGGYGVHKFSGAFSYFIRTSQYVTHVFTPASLSIIKVKAETEELINEAAEHPELLKVLASDEFIPSIGYGITYSDYRTKRPVNTMIDLEIKDAGNLVNAVYCLFGHPWGELDKPIAHIPFNQFVRLTAELWNKFNLTDRVCIATRLFAGANFPLGNSEYAPLSESFYAGGPNSLRAAEAYAYGPGNFHSFKYNQNFFHAGDVKLEANFELRFPLVWKINGAVFLDAGNVWNWRNTSELLSSEDYAAYCETMGLTEELQDGIIGNPNIAKQIALGTGAGLRLDIDGLVVRLDLGIGIHAPYQTYKYNKDGTPDLSRPINTYYNIPSAFDGLRLNFSIGYPF